MQATITNSALRRALGYALGLTAVWAIAAALRPDTTYHLAPLLVAGTLPFVAASEIGTPTVRAVAGSAAAGTAVAVVATGVLAAADWMRGPSLLPFGGAVTEALAFAFGGGIAGLIISLVRRA